MGGAYICLICGECSKDLSYFSIPKGAMRNFWVKNLHLSEEMCVDDSRICELHFSEHDFIKKKDEVLKRRRIKKTAIPNRDSASSSTKQKYDEGSTSKSTTEKDDVEFVNAYNKHPEYFIDITQTSDGDENIQNRSANTEIQRENVNPINNAKDSIPASSSGLGNARVRANVVKNCSAKAKIRRENVNPINDVKDTIPAVSSGSDMLHDKKCMKCKSRKKIVKEYKKAMNNLLENDLVTRTGRTILETTLEKYK